MLDKSALGQDVSVEEAANEQIEFEEERPDLRPSVEQEIQAKVDMNHPDAKRSGLTLAAEERLEAREWEIERTQVRFDRRQESDREARSRQAVAQVSVERRREFAKRAASVDPWADPDVVDPREQLPREELAAVNREAMRMAEKLPRWSRAAISRRLAERVVDGAGMTGAVIGVFEELRTAPGQVIPIAAVEGVRRREVDIEGKVAVLWEPSHPRIQQVGLIEDESGRVKFTVWRKSNQPMMRKGEHVKLENVARNWYNGRISVALTGWSRIEFVECDWLDL